MQQFDESVGLYVPIGTDEAYQQAKYTNPSLGWTTPEGWGTAFAKIHPNAMEGFRIYSQEDLDELNYVVNSSSMYEAIKHVYLETDIDMNGYEWTAPIGNTPEHAFKGTFHGQGHYIRNLKVNSQDIAGLFGYFNGEKITGVRLENCDFRGKELAGGLVAECGACTIDSSYVYAATRSDVLAGGIVGRSTGFVNIDRCVAGGLAFPYTISGGANPLLAGIIGSTTGTLVTNCAMMKSFADYARYSIFVGECTSDFVSMVNYSYSGQHETAPIDSEATGICYGEHILQYGQPLSIIDYAGNRQDMTYNESTLRSVYPASVLGFEGWAYNNGEFPLPDCFTDRWPTKPNHAVYGSPALAAESINVLTPDEFIPPSAWLDLSDIGFRHYSFRASRLWIDGNMDVFDRAEQLPLGLSEQITVEQGILLEDTLHAVFTGTEPVYKPVYLLNDKNELVYEMSEYDTRGVAKVLTPYYYKDEKELLFSYGLTQFQAGKARVIKVLKDYVEFSATDVTVKAEAEEMSPVLLWGNVQNVSGTWQGTFARIDNEEAALMKAHTLYSNGKWYRIRSDEGRYRDAWVGAFRGYYTPIEQPSVGSLSAVFKLWVQGDDDDPITRFPSDLFVSDSNFSNYDTEGTGIELPSLAPAAEEEAWFTLDGRKLDSKPQTKGLYIYKGKKIVIK